MNMFKDINTQKDDKKRQVQNEKEEIHEHIKKFIDLFADHFPEMKEALEERGYEVEIVERENLHGKLLKVINSKDLGLFYHLDPQRDAIAVHFNQGKLNRSNLIYYPTKYEHKRLERPRNQGGVTDIDNEVKKHYTELLELLES